ncbi:MAG: glycosyltransferase family 39 protein [Cytophagales bacterium]|nr:glycosyltransferase family 39 protein [Cytophagales bacterium]
MVNAYFLDIYPLFQYDEVYINSASHQYAMHGQFKSDMHPHKKGFEWGYFAHPPGHFAIQYMVYKIFGFGWFQTRFTGLIFGGIFIFLAGYLTNTCTKQIRNALLCEFTLMLNPHIVYTSSMGRMDTEAMTFSTLAIIFIYIYQNTQKNKFLYLAGFAAGISCMFHLCAILLAISIGVSYLIITKKWKSFIIFGSLAAVPLSMWVGYGMLFHRQYFYQQAIGHSTEKWAGMHIIYNFVDEIVRTGFNYRFFPFYILFILCGLLFPLLYNKRNNSPYFHLLILIFLIDFIFTSLLMTKVSGYYNLYYIVIANIAVCTIWQLRHTHILQVVYNWLIILCTVNLIIFYAIPHYAAALAQKNERDYNPISEGIKKIIPPGVNVCGIPEAWYAVIASGSNIEVTFPNPQKHHYIIKNKHNTDFLRYDIPPNYVPVATIGKEITPFMGFTFSSTDYQMTIYKNTILCP